MSTLRILHLEDNFHDGELCLQALTRAGLDCEIVRVDSEAGFAEALKKCDYDLIISDFSLPGFDGKSALAYANKNCPDTPFMFVSGTIGEDAAIEGLLNGATDYVPKQKFSRLVPAVRRVLREANEKKIRHQAEQAIRESEEKYRRVFEESRDAIFIRTPAGRFVDINPAGIEMLGYRSKDELLHVDIPGSLYQDPSSWAELQKTIERDGYIRNFEVTLNKRDSSPLTVIETTTAVRNERGEVITFDGIWHDVTEARRLEAQFLRAQRLENIGKLASGVAHDLNNILSPILMGVQLLRERVDDPASMAMLDTLQKSGQRGADLVRQITAFARGTQTQRCLLQLRHLINDVEKIMRGTLPKSITVDTDTPRDLWVVVADGTQMHQVLMNLCVNARDAMPDGGVLTISARNVTLGEPLARWGLEIGPGPYVVMEVSDTGTGISPENLNRILEPFFTTKELGKGTGLGLSTVQAILKTHAGLVDINSVLNRGTVVSVYIPAEVARREGDDEEREPAAPGNGELILVVDDEAAVRDIARATLEAYGYRVMTAADGAEGLAVFVQNKDQIRVVLTDVNMPILGGRGLVQSLERIDPNIRVICASGSSAAVGDAPPTTGIVRAHLEKPFTTETLLQTLTSVIRMP